MALEFGARELVFDEFHHIECGKLRYRQAQSCPTLERHSRPLPGSENRLSHGQPVTGADVVSPRRATLRIEVFL
jgi:hypothetical protein